MASETEVLVAHKTRILAWEQWTSSLNHWVVSAWRGWSLWVSAAQMVERVVWSLNSSRLRFTVSLRKMLKPELLTMSRRGGYYETLCSTLRLKAVYKLSPFTIYCLADGGGRLPGTQHREISLCLSATTLWKQSGLKYPLFKYFFFAVEISKMSEFSYLKFI